MRQKTIFVLTVCAFVLWKPHAPTLETSTDASTVSTQSSEILAIKVPNGWYFHETHGTDTSITVLSRTKD